jgi:hypothetical protein
MKLMLVISLTFLLSACSTGSTFYQQESSSKKVFWEASTECKAEIHQKNGPPSYADCMKTKGWTETANCQTGLRCVRK